MPAIGINGYLECEIYHGSFDQKRFINFIRKLLRKMNPYPGPRSVLVMDNCRTHHSEEMKEMIRQAGVRLEYLPPYSPDFSPIEKSFHALKSWIRRNRAHAVRFQGFFELFLWMGIVQCDFKNEAKNFFRDCQITVDRDTEDIDYNEL